MILGLLVIDSTVVADDSLYVTAKRGTMSFERDLGLSPYDTIERNQDSWNAGFGYSLNRHLAFQAEHLDLGEVTHTRLCGPPERLCLSMPPVTLATSGLSVSVVPQLPLSRLASVFAKIGLIRLKTKAFSVDRIESEREADKLHYGAGFRLELGSRLSLLAEYGVAASEVSNISIGASFEF